MKDVYVGIDIGATWIRLALANEKGILKPIKIPTPRDSLKLIRALIDNTRKLLDSISSAKLISIGIGSIGPLDLRKGTLEDPANLPIGIVNVVEPLEEEFNVPVYLLNDCSAGVIGEKIFGAGKDVSNLVYITMSTGIGGGAIVDNHLLFGKDGNAVEIGHIVVDFEARLKCGCGGYGHWEAYASGANIPNFAKMLIENEYASLFKESLIYRMVNGDLDKLDAKMLYDAALKNDKLALEIINRINEINTVGIASVINIFDPELITLGGAIILNNRDLILPYIKKHLHNYTINRIPRIEITPLGENIVLHGAIALAMNPDFIIEKFRKPYH